MAGKLILNGTPSRNVIVTREGENFIVKPFEQEIHSTPFYPEVIIEDGEKPRVIARDGIQSIIIDM